MKRIPVLFSLFAVLSLPVSSQTLNRLTDSLHYHVEMQATVGSGSHSPLWLNANKYGLSSTDANYYYLRAGIIRPLETDSSRRWGTGYALDIVVGEGLGARFVVHQAYLEQRWLKGVLTIGVREYPMELKPHDLSSGAQTFGRNARPVPQVRLALGEYWTIPYTRGWVAIKGHLAYGRFSDNAWQRNFTHEQSRYTQGALYHSKAGYLKFGTGRLTLETGLEMASEFGGTTYYADGNSVRVIKNRNSLGSYFRALIPGGSEVVEKGTAYENNEGNQLGSWVARLNYEAEKWGASVYADKYFEDHSAMFLLDYDGYGTGKNWDVKEKKRFFMYDPKDIMLGMDVRLKSFPWLNHIVVEYLYTKYQSGPVYHDHTISFSDHICGRDDYYNHSLFTGWQHWGQVMGNPLYLSPLYNDNHKIMVQNNRFEAFHIGVSGDPLPGLQYRLMVTTQDGLGVYGNPYYHEKHQTSLLGEISYQPTQICFKGWSMTAAFGLDRGQLRGDNQGVQFTVRKTGLIRK